MSAEASPSTAAHSSSSESNSQCHTQFHSLADPPFFDCTGVCASNTHTHARTRANKGGHSADCLLYTPERLATWLLLTFNRVHYGGCALVQLLLYTEDAALSFCLRLLALALLSDLNPSPCVGPS